MLKLTQEKVDQEQQYNEEIVQVLLQYCKVPKFLDTRKLYCNLPKIQTKRPNLRVFRQKDANAIANSEDPDWTAPLGAICTGSALFAHTCFVRKLRKIEAQI